MKYKIKLTKVPDGASGKVGDWLPVDGEAKLEALKATGYDYIDERDDKLICSRRASLEGCIQASKAFAPKQDTSSYLKTALLLEEQEDGAGVRYINSLPATRKEMGERLTTSQSDTEDGQYSRFGHLDITNQGLKETIKGFLVASEPEYKNSVKKGDCLFIRASNRGESAEREIASEVTRAREKTNLLSQINEMIHAGGNFSLNEDLIKATYDGYADPAGALGVLNTALMLNWTFGHLENQLIMLDDITTDLSGTPVKFNQWARSRYIKVPGVQLKTASNSWSGTTGNDVDVSVLMNNYAGVPLTINNFTLGSTGRQLMNEQKAPQLYGLAEYILYTVINTAINGSTRFANDGITTSTITASSAFVDPTFGKGYFNVAGATLSTFVSSVRAAMNLSKFPGGSEPPGAADLMRYAWVHSSLHASISADPAFQLNESIQGIAQNKGENLIQTGMFTRIGNNKFRESQLVLDNNSTTGTGADGSANAMFVVPGSYPSAKVVGIGGTRSGLMFVSRAPLDYRTIMPEIPSTAAIELYVTPKLGITFMLVKYLDHSSENANMRAQAQWGSGIGDERQLMLFRQQ